MFNLFFNGNDTFNENDNNIIQKKYSEFWSKLNYRPLDTLGWPSFSYIIVKHVVYIY